VDSLITGLLFLLNGAGAALISLPGRYKIAGWVAWALMVVCLGMFLEGIDVSVPWRAFVETCFAIWAVLFAIPFVQTARRSDPIEDGPASRRLSVDWDSK
jgi:hypothetical protein